MNFNIGSFLEKFKNLTPPDDAIRSAVVEAVEKEVGVVLKKSDVTIQGGTVYCAASPTVKNEIFIKKPLLLKRLQCLAPAVNNIR